MPEVHIAATPRTEFGKGPARRERRAGRVPAVLYGHGAEPRHVSLPGHDVLLALRTANVLIRVIKGTVEHVDLIVVRQGEKVTVDIPVTVTGEIAPDGLLDQQLVQISVEAEATAIPPGVEVSVEGMAIGASVHAGDLRLPRGVTLADEPDMLVLHVIPAPTAAQLEAELGVVAEAEEAAEVPEAVGEGAGGAEGAAQAPPAESSQPAGE